MAMPQVQQFKIYIDRDSEDERETRRFNLPLPAYDMFALVQQKILRIMGTENFRITWKDSDGDVIDLKDEDDFEVVLFDQTKTGADLIALWVKSLLPPQYQASATTVTPRLLEGSLQTNRTRLFTENPHGTEKHRNIICDKCDKTILGTRYKCLVCPDFDLCVTCEAKGFHREHDAVAIRDPKQWEWKKLFAARGQQPAVSAPQPQHDGPTVELDLNLNQPLESLLRDVNTQVQRVLRGFMPQDITVSTTNTASNAAPQTTTQETFTETVIVVEKATDTAQTIRDHEVETLHESVTEQGTARPEEKVAESIYPVISPELVKATEQAETVRFAEPRRSASPVSLESSGEEDDWAFVSEDVSTKEAVADAAPVVKEHPGVDVEAALDAMNEMGFTNEGNVLRALLETFKGDIGKVVDTINEM